MSRDGNTGFGNAVRKELLEKGYELFAVHPEADAIADQPCAHSLAEVAPRVGGVVMVTPPPQTLKLVEEAAACGVRRIWMQQGAESPDAALPEPVTEADLASLPEAARRYLRFMGVLGRPRDWSFLCHLDGRFLFGGEWVPCECAQYNSRLAISRIFHMRLRVKHIVPTYVRDTYVRGRGRMLGKALDTFTMVDDASEEIAIGECVTYLNDAVLMAPSMLLVPEVTWTDAGAHSFDLALTDGGRTVRARVFVSDDGAPTDFATTDRFYAPPGQKGPPARVEWRTPVEGWQEHAGRKLPTVGRAVWMLPSGPLAYAELRFDPAGFVADVAPRG